MANMNGNRLSRSNIRPEAFYAPWAKVMIDDCTCAGGLDPIVTVMKVPVATRRRILAFHLLIGSDGFR